MVPTALGPIMHAVIIIQTRVSPKTLLDVVYIPWYEQPCKQTHLLYIAWACTALCLPRAEPLDTAPRAIFPVLRLRITNSGRGNSANSSFRGRKFSRMADISVFREYFFCGLPLR